MYAIIEAGGKQYDVKTGDVIQVEKIDQEIGSKITFSALFAKGDDDKIVLGKDASKIQVTAEVVAHGKGDKIIVFKMIPKEKYRRKNGHRQPFTELKILEIK